jgi:hydrogenase maturation protease
MKKILIYGYGNPGRQDDALANEVINKIEDAKKDGYFAGIDTDSNYQLNIEDAEIISRYDTVVFVDASTEDIEDVVITEVSPSDAKVEFTMHAVSPSFVLDLCIKMYNKKPEVYLMHIKGYEWEFMEAMTEEAKENLEKAFAVLFEKYGKTK